LDTLPLETGRGILCLRPNVSRADALREFSAAGPLRRLAHGPLRRMADVYIPYRLYRVELRDARASKIVFLALDSVRGNFDAYSFPAVPQAPELSMIDTRNHPEPCVPEEQARAEALQRGRRLAYRRGLLRIRDLSLSAELILPELYVPYWAGFFGRSAVATQVRVLDAVRRRMEGDKINAFVREWLAV
jgi:hypothetical protein